jgi:hypothetical protein
MFCFFPLGKSDVLLSSRTSVIPESSSSGPIYICTRNDDLDAIIEKTPLNRREDLVFLQNGMLGPYLEGKGLTQNTQGVVNPLNAYCFRGGESILSLITLISI